MEAIPDIKPNTVSTHDVGSLIVQKAVEKNKTPQQIAEKLVKKAGKNGSNDNITVIVKPLASIVKGSACVIGIYDGH